MSKYIDIDNEEEILKECDFDYFYNSENCSSELCAFYNDIWRNGNNENFDKSQALIDLGRIGIVLNNQSQQIAQLKAENERLHQQLKDNTKQVRKEAIKYSVDFIEQHKASYLEIRNYFGTEYVWFNKSNLEKDILDQIENEKLI